MISAGPPKDRPRPPLRAASGGGPPPRSRYDSSNAAVVRLPVRYRKECATLLMLVAVATEFVGVSIGLPILVQYAASLGVHESNVGLVFSVGAFAAVLSNFWLPSVSDRTGRKTVVALSLAGSAVSYALQAAAPTFELLLLSIFLGRIFGGTQPVAVAYISDIFSPLQRPRLIGMVPACASACYIIGPTLGGLLSKMSGSFRVPLAAAAGLVLIMLPVVVLFLPDPTVLISPEEKEELNKKQAEEHGKVRESVFYTVEELPSFHSELMGDVEHEGSPLKGEGDGIPTMYYPGPLWDWRCHVCFWVQFFNTAAFSAFTTCVPLILDDPVFRLSDREKDAVFYTGIVIGCGAAVKSIGLILLFDRVQRRIGLARTVAAGSTASLLAFVVLSLQSSVRGVAAGFGLFALGTSMLQPGIFSYVTVMAPIEFTARAIAMPDAAVSFGQMFAPIASTRLLAATDYHVVFQVISAALLVQVLIAMTLLRKGRSAEGEGLDISSDDEEDFAHLPTEDFETFLAESFIATLRRRHYDLSDHNTQRAVLELISRSFPFLGASEAGNRQDVERLMNEMSIPHHREYGSSEVRANSLARGEGARRLALAGSVQGSVANGARRRPRLDRTLGMGASSRVLDTNF